MHITIGNPTANTSKLIDGLYGIVRLNEFDFVDRERLKTAIHEAGHTLVARLNAVPVPWVSNDPDFIRSDPVAIATKNEWASALCMTINSQRLGPILANGRMVRKDEKRAVIAYGVQVLAGPVAEHRFDPDNYDHDSAAGDQAQVAMILASVLRTKSERKKLFVEMRREVSKVVPANWPAILRLAVALIRSGTLHTDEIDRLIAQPTEVACEAAA
jgi:hypothetical protein